MSNGKQKISVFGLQKENLLSLERRDSTYSRSMGAQCDLMTATGTPTRSHILFIPDNAPMYYRHVTIIFMQLYVAVTLNLSKSKV